MGRIAALATFVMIMTGAGGVQGVGPTQDDAGTGGDAGDYHLVRTPIAPASFDGRLDWQVDTQDVYEVVFPPGRPVWVNLTGSPYLELKVNRIDPDGSRMPVARSWPDAHVSHPFLVFDDRPHVIHVDTFPRSVGSVDPYHVEIGIGSQVSVVQYRGVADSVTVESRYDTPGQSFRTFAFDDVAHFSPSDDRSNVCTFEASLQIAGGPLSEGAMLCSKQRFGYGHEVQMGPLGSDMLGDVGIPLPYSNVPSGVMVGTETGLVDSYVGNTWGWGQVDLIGGSRRDTYMSSQSFRYEILLGYSGEWQHTAASNTSQLIRWAPEADVEVPMLRAPLDAETTRALSSDVAVAFSLGPDQDGGVRGPTDEEIPTTIPGLPIWALHRPEPGAYTFRVHSDMPDVGPRAGLNLFGGTIPDLGVYEPFEAS